LQKPPNHPPNPQLEGDLFVSYVTMTTTCPECGDDYAKLGNHYQWNPDHRPALTERQLAITDYLVLRGATVRQRGSCPYLEVCGTAKFRIRSLADALGWLANDVRPWATDLVGERSDMYGFTTVPHPALGYDGPTDVERLRLRTLGLVVAQRGTFVGTIFGSLHLDVRGFDVSGEHLRTLLHREGVSTVEYDGDGYARNTPRCRYHYHPDVVVVPHYDALEVLETVGLSVSDVAEPIEQG
jgi:hypothetical protein